MQKFKEYYAIKKDQWKLAVEWLVVHGYEINEHNVELVASGLDNEEQLIETVEQK